MSIIKRYPLVITLPFGMVGGAVVGFIHAIYRASLEATEFRQTSPNELLYHLWYYIAASVSGMSFGMIIAVIAALIIYLAYREPNRTE